MREPKKLKTSPTGAGSIDNASVPVASPSPLNGRQGAKTPKQEVPNLSNSSGNPTPESIKDPWGLPTQPPTPNGRLIKSEYFDDNMRQMQSPGAAQHPPVSSSPLDQFKKDDPMEKMAQMASSIGSSGPPSNAFMNLRSPASAPMTPQSAANQIPPQSPVGMGMQQQPVGNMGGMPGSRVSLGSSAAPSPMMNQGMTGHPVHAHSMSPLSAHQNMNPASGTVHSVPHGMSPGPQMQPSPGGPQQQQPIPHQPYMQEQSVVFVFSTELGNQAAEAVKAGHFPSILHFHWAQESTQRMLKSYGYNGIPPQCLRNGPDMRNGPGRNPFFNKPPHLNSNNMPGQYGHQNGPNQNGMMPLSPPGNCGGPPMMENGGMCGMGDMPVNLPQDKAQKLQRLRIMQESCGYGSPTPEMDPNQVAPPPPYTMQPGMGPGQMPPQPRMPGRPPSNKAMRNMNQIRPRMDGTPDLILPSDFDAVIKSEGPPICSPGFNTSPDPAFPMMNQMGGKVRETGVTNVMPVPSPTPVQYISPVDAQEVVIQKQPNKNYNRAHMNMMAGGPQPGSGPHPRMGMPPMGPRGRMGGPPPGMMPQNGPMGMDPMGMPPGYPDNMAGSRMPGGMMSPPLSQMSPQMQGHPGQPQHHQYGQSFPPNGPQYQQHGPPMDFPPQMMPHPNSMSPRLRHPGPPVPNGPGPQGVYQTNPTFDPNFRQQFPHMPVQPNGHPGHPPHPQTVNNTYISAQLTVEQVNIQQHQPNPYDTGSQFSQSQTTLNYTADVPNGLPAQYEAPPNIQIKPGAPNTIQYMPTRPPPPKQSRGPPNLDFLQQWTGKQNGQPQQYGGYQNGPGPGNMPGGMPPSMQENAMMNYGPPPGQMPNNQMLNDNSGSYMAASHQSFQQFQQSLYSTNMVGGQNGPGPNRTPVPPTPQQ